MLYVDLDEEDELQERKAEKQDSTIEPRSGVPAIAEIPLRSQISVERATGVFDKIVSTASKLDRLFFSSLKILLIILLIEIALDLDSSIRKIKSNQKDLIESSDVDSCWS